MTKRFVTLLLLATSFVAFSQEAASYKLYGFVRSDYTLDSRKILSSSQDIFSLYPMYKDLNAAGEDLNATPSASFTSVTTRFGFNLSIPTDFLGAKKAIGKIETDFAGAPNYMLLRIRQAYTQLTWEKSSLLVGQTWHPMAVFGTHPLVLSLNTGALFQPFNRSPQIRYDYYLKNVKFSAAAIYEMQFTSYGPDASTPATNVASYTFQRNALLPELYVSLETKVQNLLLGIGGEYKSIMPNRYYSDGVLKHVNTNVLRTPGMVLYGSWTDGKLTVNSKAILGQNLTHLNLIGGYAVTPDNKYIPYHTFSSYIDVNYGVKHLIGLLAGYTKNLGPAKDLPTGSSIYGLGVDKANTTSERVVNNIYRITPTYSYNYKNWKLGVECEYTNAAWGIRSPKGAIIQPERISNTRMYAILAYTF